MVAIQPLIEPLFGGRTALELVAQLGKFETTQPHEIVRRAFRKVSGVGPVELRSRPGEDFSMTVMLAGSAYPVVTPTAALEGCG